MTKSTNEKDVLPEDGAPASPSSGGNKDKGNTKSCSSMSADYFFMLYRICYATARALEIDLYLQITVTTSTGSTIGETPNLSK